VTELEDTIMHCYCLALNNVGIQYIDSPIIRICVCVYVCVRARGWAFTPVSCVWSLFKLMWEKLHCIYWSLKQQNPLCTPANVTAELH